MAKKKSSTNKTIKTVKKISKKVSKNKSVQVLVFILIIVVLAVAAFLLKDYIFPKENNESSSTPISEVDSKNHDSSSTSEVDSQNHDSSSTSEVSSHEHAHAAEGIKYDNFQIHFMTLGNASTGDSVYIKAGNTDILIDAGSEMNSSTTIIDYVNNYCNDGKLEYVITTHGDSDHITGMFGTKKSSKNYKNENITRDGTLYYYDVDTLIDFAFTTKTTTNIQNYYDARDYAISKGTTHYTARQCFDNQDGAKRSYTLDETNDITMDVLYNKYYYELDSDENNHSVCVMFNYNDHHFMLTGDLEEKGEQAMALYYDKSTPEKTLPHVDLFKAGHHGSKTSSNDCLLSLITPDICCVCCCAGGSEYTPYSNNTFPTQDFIDRIAKYTDKVYVTSCIKEKESREQSKYVFDDLNGTICVSFNGTEIGLWASNNLTKLKDSQWFNEIVYLDDSGKICSGSKQKDFFDENTIGVHQVPRRIWPENGVSNG